MARRRTSLGRGRRTRIPRVRRREAGRRSLPIWPASGPAHRPPEIGPGSSVARYRPGAMRTRLIPNSDDRDRVDALRGLRSWIVSTHAGDRRRAEHGHGAAGRSGCDLAVPVEMHDHGTMGAAQPPRGAAAGRVAMPGICQRPKHVQGLVDRLGLGTGRSEGDARAHAGYACENPQKLRSHCTRHRRQRHCSPRLLYTVTSPRSASRRDRTRPVDGA